MSTLLRLIRHTLRFPMRSTVSLILAICCTLLVLVLPGVTMRFIDVVMKDHRPDLIVSTAALGIAAILLRQILFAVRTYWNNILELKLTHQIRREVYDKLQRLPVKWFDVTQSGEIMTRVADDVPTMDRVIVEGVDQAIAAVIQFIVVIGYMLYFSWQLTLITLIPLPFIGMITIWWSKRAESKWRESSEATSALHSLLHDNLAGIRQIKAYTVEPESLAQYDAASQLVSDKHMNVMRGQAVIWPAVSLIAESGIILMVAYGAWSVLNGKMSAGTPMAFLVAWGFLFDPISRINPLSQTFTRGIVAAKRIFAILDTPDEKNLDHGLRPTTFTGEVRFDKVSFSYAEKAPTLHSVSLHAAAGETIALVGPTGAGKSTILNLLTRFYEADEGEILLDGVSIAGISKEWLRDNTGYVTQESFLFNSSIRDNLKLAKKDATDEELWSVLASANAADFVKACPEGLDTFCGERGVRFSGGEKQRLSIARALLKNPPLLLLDEATSALDTRTEGLVQHALDNLRSNRTCFIIAHRLSTVRNADRIYVLKNGEIAETGTHEKLIQENGLYAELAKVSLK